MFRKLYKSQSYAIYKSLYTSPLGLFLQYVILLLSVLSIFYGVYLFNLDYLEKSSKEAILLICIELFIIYIILVFFIAIYDIILYIINCINKTMEKYDKDLEKYELDSISWQK